MDASRLHITGRFSKDIRPVVMEDEHGPVYFYPLPYVEPAAVRDGMEDETIHGHDEAMARLMEIVGSAMDKRARNILVTHTFAAGGEASESERPLSIGGSAVVDSKYFRDFNYVALGHLHRPQKLGTDNIRYSGSLMKYSFSEADQKKHIPIVDMDANGEVHMEYAELRPKRDMSCIEGYLEEILKGPQKGENREDYMMVTLKDEGAILDAMGKVRSVYPNTLHIERPQLVIKNNICGPDSNFKSMGICDLFSSFFKQVTDTEISEEQAAVFEDIVSKYNTSLRGE
jgi:exonuclease SbcD